MCLCCTGHFVVIPVGVQAVAAVIAHEGRMAFPAADDLQPKEVVGRIFHPPKPV
jgi:hypothetical protein